MCPSYYAMIHSRSILRNSGIRLNGAYQRSLPIGYGSLFKLLKRSHWNHTSSENNYRGVTAAAWIRDLDRMLDKIATLDMLVGTRKIPCPQMIMRSIQMQGQYLFHVEVTTETSNPNLYTAMVSRKTSPKYRKIKHLYQSQDHHRQQNSPDRPPSPHQQKNQTNPPST